MSNAYSVQTLKNEVGRTYTRLAFATFEDLEAFFAREMIGNQTMKGCSSKVIGTALLIWDKD